jgi:hypothetical protein
MRPFLLTNRRERPPVPRGSAIRAALAKGKPSHLREQLAQTVGSYGVRRFPVVLHDYPSVTARFGHSVACGPEAAAPLKQDEHGTGRAVRLGPSARLAGAACQNGRNCWCRFQNRRICGLQLRP